MVARGLDKEMEEILSHIEQNHNFLLSGGAGSGKTYSLVEVLKRISILYPNAKVACITYTNAAAVEIMNRTNIVNLAVSTIHDFLWNNISLFPNELRTTLVGLVNDEHSDIKRPKENKTFELVDDVTIQYKEYTKLVNGEISHDEVLILANAMFKKYPKLCTILKDKYQFIFVDEYQDTSPLVIEILLKYLQISSHKNIVGFFGDSMQSIYDRSVGNIDEYVSRGIVYKVEKKQNRRNPNAIINLANKLRLDGLEQKESDDADAPNMVGGKLKEGTIKFLYSNKSDMSAVKESQWCHGWDFGNSKQTKELRLTHNLISSEAGFGELMNIYDNDPVYKFKKDFKKVAEEKEYVIDMNATFEEVVEGMDWKYVKGTNSGKQHLEVLLEKEEAKVLYDYIKAWSYEKVSRIYMDKDSLLDDKVETDGGDVREAKRDYLIQHLFKIQDLIYLYKNSRYNELLQKAQKRVVVNGDKKRLVNSLKKLISMENESIESVINFAAQEGLCVKDDKFLLFIEENEYLYWRVKKIAFSEFQNLYKYLEGFTPFSTQHKIKGLEFENVLVFLQNGGWSNYNFEYLFDQQIYSELSKAKQATYSKILERTKKLFYVCCTRAKDNLVVFYPNPTERVLEGAKELFGTENCINLDENGK
ncbi:MAG: AAA family ATPase [Selenomonadaceae bacterium]|nr:AAA family ATPase [Selenomonadaceae bacterium]